MTLIDELRAEHALIESVVGSLRTWAHGRARDTDARDAAEGYLRFFRLYAERFHHAREESILFPALVREAEVPADRGPLRALADGHRAMGHMLDELEPLLASPRTSELHATRLVDLVERYAEALLHHIDAENSVLFPEAERRLPQAGAPLENRPPDAEEAAARAWGERLVTAYPPSESARVLRGDGCVACPAYGVACDGLEREWWNEHEWDAFFARND